MNEKMWEIAEEAKDQGPNFHYYDPVFLLEYTRLIVEECASIADRNSPLSYPDHGIKIKRHFGVDW